MFRARTLSHASLLVLLMSCTGGDKADPGEVGGGSDGSDGTEDDTGGGEVPLDWACDSEADLGELSTELAEVETVLLASWGSDSEATGVRFLTGAGLVQDAAEDATWLGQDSAMLLGLRSNQDVELRLMKDDGSSVVCGPIVTATTGSLDSALPEIKVLKHDQGASHDGYVSVVMITQAERYAAILDRDGEYVWAAPSFNATRALLSPEGPSIATNPHQSVPDGVGWIMERPLTGGEPRMLEAPLLHTDFALRPGGGYVSLGWDLRTVEGDVGPRYILGDTLVEIEPDGESRVVWNIFDDLSPDLTQVYDENSMVDPDGLRFIEDWSHANGINISHDAKAWLATVTINNSIVRVDRGTGQTDWWLRGDGESGGDFSTDDDTLLVNPHSVQDLGDRLLSFSRGYYTETGECSWATSFAYDATAKTAAKEWQYDGEDCLLVPFLGDATRLDSGNTLVTFSSAGRMEEVTADGELVWSVETALGGAFGFAHYYDSLYNY